MKFSIKRRGKRWRLEYNNGATRKRLNFKTKELAEAEESRIRGDVERSGVIWVNMSGPERNALMAFYAEIKAAGHTPQEVWGGFRHRKPTQSKSKTGIQVLEDMAIVKTDARRDHAYLRSLKQEVKKFCKGREAIPMVEYTLEDLKAHLARFSPAYQKTIRSRLATWFKYGVKFKHCPQNLCDLIESINVEASETRIFSIEEFKTLLEWFKSHPKAVGWFALSTFCGLRPNEARKYDPKKINFDEGWIPVDGKVTRRKSNFRIVYPLPEAMAALKYVIEKLKPKLPIAVHELRQERREMRKVIGQKGWPQDITRHTAASFWGPIAKDIRHVCEQLGHSEKVHRDKYKKPLPLSMAKKYLDTIMEWIGATQPTSVGPKGTAH